MQRLKEDFVIASHYADVHNDNVIIPESEQFYFKALDQQIVTLGVKNADMQVTKFGASTQPSYFFLNANQKQACT